MGLVWLGTATALAWSYLVALHGRFWRADQTLPEAALEPTVWPSVTAVVPARDEAAVIQASLGSLLDQDYPGALRVVLVDDESSDGTADQAQGLSAGHPEGARAVVVATPPRPPGWVGKMWAVATGVAVARQASSPRYLLLTDADIVHPPNHLRRLVAVAEADRLDLVSQMVILESRGGWARLLIPAFVYFFQQLYPFPRVNDPAARTAAAAGGVMLVRSDALVRAGGIEAVRGEVIDDCALARRLKRRGPIWLGLGARVRSIRPYVGVRGVWDMVARTAFNQLRHSWILLLLTAAGLVLVYLVPPALVASAPLHRDPLAAGIGAVAWALMTLTFLPTLRRYGAPALAPWLPIAALVYLAMTIDSAWRHARGRGAEWKGRVGAGGRRP